MADRATVVVAPVDAEKKAPPEGGAFRLSP